MVVQMQLRELRVAVLEFESDLAAGAPRGGAHLRYLVLEAIWQLDSGFESTIGWSLPLPS